MKVVHSRKAHVSSSSRLTFKNGTELPPFSNTVNVVTFTWLTGKEEEVRTYCRLYALYSLQSNGPSCNVCSTGFIR